MCDMANGFHDRVDHSVMHTVNQVVLAVADPNNASFGVLGGGYRELDRLHMAIRKLFFLQILANHLLFHTSPTSVLYLTLH